MARVRRSWTSKEDKLLRQAVMAAEQQHQPLLWRELAKAVPGRSNKDCRRRWWNSLSDGKTKGPWSENEDERLIAAIQRWGTNWTKVAGEVGSRSADQCSSHWSQVLDPKINYCDWTEEEDADLLHEVLTNGTKWAQITSVHTPTRTTLALKNRYSTLRVKNENRSRARHDHPTPSSGHATLQSIHAQASSGNSEGDSMSNSSDISESLPSDDVEEEEEELETEKENGKGIRTWLEDVSGDMNIQHDGSMNTRPSRPSGTALMRMEGINVSKTDNTAWYQYPKESVLPTPDMNDDSGIAMDEYVQLDPSVLRGRATDSAFNLPTGGGFFEQQQPSPSKRNTSHVPHELSTENQPLSDTAGCFQPTHATSLEGSTKVPECNDWVMGNNASVPKTTPSFPSPVPHNGTPSAPKSIKFRVSITLTCDQAQLASTLTQLTDFGTGLSISVEEYN